MSGRILTINFIGLILVPVLALLQLNPFIVVMVLGLLTSSYLLRKSGGFITLIWAWNLGYLFIVNTDGLFNYSNIKADVGTYPMMICAILVSYSYFLINIFYILLHKGERFSHRETTNSTYVIGRFDKQKPLSGVILLIFYIIYLYYKLPVALNVFLSGRFEQISNSDFGGLSGATRATGQTMLAYLVAFIGLILPVLVYHYIQINSKRNRNRLRRVILLVAPIFIVQLMLGTRYVLLLSFGAFLVAYFYYNHRRIKKFRVVAAVLFIIFLGSSAVSVLRGKGFGSLLDTSTDNSINVQYNNTENTVRYMTMVVDYYSDKSHELGSSLSSVFLFWIPRAIWEDKPTMFGYWFIRDYYGTSFERSEKLSAPASYLAESYSDFGIMGILGISFIFALIFTYCDKRMADFTDVFTIKKLIFYLLVPIVFFLPRGLNVPFTNFVGTSLIFTAMYFFSKSFSFLNEKREKSVGKFA